MSVDSKGGKEENGEERRGGRQGKEGRKGIEEMSGNCIMRVEEYELKRMEGKLRRN